MGSPSKLTAPKAITSFSGDQIITGSTSGQLGMTDFSGRPIKKIADLNSSVSSLCSSPDDQFIIAGCKNGNVHLFGNQPLTLIRSFKDHHFPVTGIAISPKSKRFASTSLDGKIISYSLSNLKKEWKILALDHNVSFDSIEYNSQGTKLLTSGLGSVPKLFDAKTGIAIQLKDFPYLQIIKSRFLPNGEAFVSATESGMLVFTESKHGLVYKIARLKMNKINDFSFSPFGEKIIISNDYGICSIRKTPFNNTLSVRTKDNNFIYSPDYFFALANKSKPNNSKLSDFLAKHGYPNGINKNKKGYKISPDQKLVLTSLDGSLRLWCSTTEDWIVTLGDQFASRFEDCAFSPKGDLVTGKLKTNEILFYLTKNESSFPKFTEEELIEIDSWF